MTRRNILQKVTTPDWLSFSTEERTAGYSIYETQDRFMRESMAERVLRAAGVFAIFVGYVVWFLPDSMTPEYPVMTRLTLGRVCICSTPPARDGFCR